MSTHIVPRPDGPLCIKAERKTVKFFDPSLEFRLPVRRRGEDEDLVVVVEAADVGGQPDEADETVLVAVERPHLKIMISDEILSDFRI